MTPAAYHPWRHRFALLTACATLALLSLGGLVTSHGVGMAVPDWPNTYGYNMFFFPISQWVGGVFYEHTHRLAASGVGVLTTVLALWFYGRSARRFLWWTGLVLLLSGGGMAGILPRHWADGLVLGLTGLAAFSASFVWPRCEPAPRWLRRLGLLAFAGVVLQGVLGGLRVVLFKDQIGILHAALAQLFFVLVCALALVTSRWWSGRATASPLAAGKDERSVRSAEMQRPLGTLLLAGTVLIFVQLIFGATMRHQHAGLAIPDFPLAYGKLWPATDAASVALYNQHRIEVVAMNPITAAQIVLQIVHRFLALLIVAVVAASVVMARRRPGSHVLSRLTLAWLGLLCIQALLGAATIWSNKAADIATAHVVVGALSLALGAMTSLIAFRRAEAWVRQPASPQAQSGVPLGFAQPSTAGLK